MIALICAIALLAAAKDADLSSIVQSGHAYFQAGEYNQAAECYKKVLEGKLQQDQRDIVHYNLGTIFLRQEQFDEALAEFNHIHLGNDPLPHFGKKLKMNQAIVCLKKAQLQIQNASDEAAFLSCCEEALKFLKRGLEGYHEAADYSRQIARLEGGISHAEQDELKVLHEHLKRAIADVKRAAEAFVRSHRSVQDSLALLAKGLNEALLRLEKISKERCEEPVKMTKLELESASLKKQVEDWKCLSSQEKVGDFVSQFFMSFEQGIERIEANQLIEGHVALTKAEAGIDLLICQEQQKDVLERSLQLNFETAEKIIKEPADEKIRQAYELEAVYLREVAKQLCKECQLHFQGEDEEVQFKRKLLQLLGDRLEMPMERNFESLNQTGEELWFYRAISQNEEEVLLTLCSEMRKGDNSATWPWRMRALIAKFSVRSELVKEDSLRNRFKDIEETLATAVEELPNSERALSLVEGALRSLNPMKWVEMKIAELYRAVHEELKATSPLGFVAKLKKNHEEMLHHLQEPDIMQKSGDLVQPLQKAMEYSLYDLKMGEQQLSRSIAPLFRVCLEDSEKWLWRAKNSLEGKDPRSAVEILSRAIEEQHHVLQVNQRMSPFIQRRKDEKELAAIPLRGEEYVIALVAPFPQALVAHEDSKAAWPKILELFHKGCKSAQQAKELLGGEAPHWSEAANQQKLAEQYWKEALDLLKNPNDSNKGDQDQNSNSPSGTSGGGGGDQDKEEKQPEDQSSQAPNFFELLQQMEQEDLEKNRSEAKVKQGSRPW